MVTYYSQHGEDFILDKIFHNKEDGFFVEVGCIDGRRFSNTLSLEEKGWTGLNIEAHPDYIAPLKDNRPNSTVVHTAVGDKDQSSVTFYVDRRGSLSSLDKDREKELQRDYSEYFSGFQAREVPMHTLTSIFEENKVTDIDVLSLDIEGGEQAALNGLDFNRYKPTVFVIEFDSLKDRSSLESILAPHGYVLVMTINNNLFFTTKPELFAPVKGVVFHDIELKHTGNKFDNESDSIKKVTIDTRKRAEYKQLYKVVIHNIKHKIKDLLRIYD